MWGWSHPRFVDAVPLLLVKNHVVEAIFLTLERRGGGRRRWGISSALSSSTSLLSLSSIVAHISEILSAPKCLVQNGTSKAFVTMTKPER